MTWAGTAFVLFAIGFLVKDKHFRYAALLMIAMIIMRIVCVDLAALDIIYRILAFVGLGIILLAVSFFYTKRNITQE